MAISPFNARPASPEGERRRARLAIAIAIVGIIAILLAYAVSPGVRHAVSHATHSVKHAVGHVLDPDKAKTAGKRTAPVKAVPASPAPGPHARPSSK
jgi:xanthosine utilization system XapX-like protein